ncbi:MAG TPA: hypothetical protein DD381_07070 [Lentisphaeria bacterium]|nr:MAG: hypothetical protein A2X47_10835 [Lentisphaerae bacterium GWF2_38_69]HBM16084.1 hypothetical protein [Lentisphaeria bacterium]
MPGFEEIYNCHADKYDALINHEDYQENFSKFLLQNVDWMGKKVIEAGAGTGRVTRIYAALADKIFAADRSEHMLLKARLNLGAFSDKISYGIYENLNLDQIPFKADIVIEGWSFGHTVEDKPDNIPETVESLMLTCKKLLRPGGQIIIIETLGTGVTESGAPDKTLAQFYLMLEEKYSFKKNIISTDYKFPSAEEAADVAGFFFGDDLGNRIRTEKFTIIPEFTGIWIYNSTGS